MDASGLSLGKKGKSTSTNSDKNKLKRKEGSVSAIKKRGKNVTSQKRVRKNEDLVSSKSLAQLTAHPINIKRSEKLNDDEKHLTRLASGNVKEGGTNVDSKHPVSTRMSLSEFSKNNYKLEGNMFLNVFPTLSPEKTLLKLFYMDISQLDKAKYLNQSCWLKSLGDSKMFCLCLTETKMDNPESLYEEMLKTDHDSSEEEISVSLRKQYGFSMEKQKNSLVDGNKDQSQISLLGTQLPSHAGICSSGSLLPNVIRQFPEALSTLVHFPADFISDEGKHFHSECLDNNASCLISAEIVHDSNSKPKVCSNEDSTVKVKKLAVNDEDYTYIENIASFKKGLYSHMRYQPVIKLHVNNDKLWWKEISFLHVYNITIVGIFLYFLVT